MDDPQPPLNYEASAHPTHHSASPTLPPEVVACLQNARFLHLATCSDLFPHVSLMNYTYLTSSPYTSHPTIIMTTNPSSKKTLNLINNPRVSLLVHDWVSHRPPTTSTSSDLRSLSPPRQAPRSSLASLLLNLNSSALSSISATINGLARIVEPGTDEEAYYKKRHLENNTFGDPAQEEHGLLGGGAVQPEDQDDGGRCCYIEGEEVQVVVVRVKDGRIADWKGSVRDWSVIDEGEGKGGLEDVAMVNGS
ncbi:MAG: hypothetical protein M1817_003844 [Caeruleum heppii]|nr:MAG: hypothetical protein M1817_003844 [Caeruleum heppii]